MTSTKRKDEGIGLVEEDVRSLVSWIRDDVEGFAERVEELAVLGDVVPTRIELGPTITYEAHVEHDGENVRNLPTTSILTAITVSGVIDFVFDEKTPDFLPKISAIMITAYNQNQVRRVAIRDVNAFYEVDFTFASDVNPKDAYDNPPSSLMSDDDFEFALKVLREFGESINL